MEMGAERSESSFQKSSVSGKICPRAAQWDGLPSLSSDFALAADGEHQSGK
jgi:hypothetical protein